jgi:tetratricopeptide (TPR) repeat protein
MIDQSAIYTAMRREAEAEVILREATGAARDSRELMAVYSELWTRPYRHGDFEAALAIIEEGLARLPEDAVVERANLRRDYGWQLIRLRRFAEALGPTEEAARALEGSDDRSGASRAVDQLAMVLSYLGQRDRWVELEERALALALQGPDSYTELITRLHLGVALTRTGLAARARPVYQRARELAQLMGHGYPEALEAWGSAEMEDELGNYGVAVEHRRRELRLLASFGGNPHNEAMSHAHLARLYRLLGDQSAAAIEAVAARQLAAQSGEAGYVERIDLAMAAQRWLDVAT